MLDPILNGEMVLRKYVPFTKTILQEGSNKMDG